MNPPFFRVADLDPGLSHIKGVAEHPVGILFARGPCILSLKVKIQPRCGLDTDVDENLAKSIAVIVTLAKAGRFAILKAKSIGCADREPRWSLFGGGCRRSR